MNTPTKIINYNEPGRLFCIGSEAPLIQIQITTLKRNGYDYRDYISVKCFKGTLYFMINVRNCHDTD